MHTYSELYDKFDTYLKVNPFNGRIHALADPINYIMQLGGKRVRPVFLLMAYELFEEEVRDALPAAMAIEVFHNFTLIHDDIMDQAPIRRGKVSAHVKYGLTAGILSGDIMLVYAYQYLLRLRNKKKLRSILEIFNDTAVRVCEGQQYDMNFERHWNVTIDDYIRMIEFKTAVLIAGSLKIGAMVANASPKDAQHLFEFGRNLGIAFQLQDDILDTFGDPKKFGKRVGGDIVQNKKTYLVLKALERADDRIQKELKSLLSTHSGNESDKIGAVTGLFNELRVRQHAETEKEKFMEMAYRHLDAINVVSTRKLALKKVADKLMGREV